MSEELVIEVAGTPRARPRERHGATYSRRLGRAVSVTYRPTKIRIGKNGKPTSESLQWSRAQNWYDAVRVAAERVFSGPPWSGPIWLEVDLYFPRPQSLLKPKSPDGPIRHTVKPDRDNCDKSIMDALKKAGVFIDDAQVCDGAVRKWYAAKGYSDGAVLRIGRITG